MPHTYNTPRISDVALFDTLLAVAADLQIKPEQSAINVQLDEHRTFSAPLNQLDAHKDYVAIRAVNSCLITSVSLNLPPPWNGTIRYESSPTIGKMQVSFGNHAPMDEAVRALQVIHNRLPSYERTDTFDKLLGDELAEFYRKRESSLLRLEDLSQRIIEKNDQYRQRLDTELQSSEQRLQDKYKAEFDRLAAEHAQKLQTVQGREHAVEERTKVLDDRSSRHARRQIRQDMKQAIEKRSQSFSLTPKTVHKRIVIHVLFCLAIAFLISLVVVAIKELEGKSGSELWFFFGKLSVASVATVACIIYYIRWNDHWFNRHAEEEFALKRFEIDFDRASWIVEMALEWKDEEKRELPPQLLAALSANLFPEADKTSVAKHPYEDVASMLMEASAEMNVNLPGVGAIKIDKRGRERLLKALGKDD